MWKFSPAKSESVARAEAAESELAAAMARLGHKSESVVRAEAAEAKLAAFMAAAARPCSSPPKSESVMRAEAAEAKLAEFMAAAMAASPGPSPTKSESVMRAEAAEAKLAAFMAGSLGSSAVKSESVMRAEAAEAKLAALMAGSPGSGAFKSESVMRAEAAEARLAALMASSASDFPSGGRGPGTLGTLTRMRANTAQPSRVSSFGSSGSSPPKSESMMRAEAAEAKLAELMGRASPAKSKSVLRAEAAEAKLAAVQKKMAAKEKKKAKDDQARAFEKSSKDRFSVAMREMKANIKRVQMEMQVQYAAANSLDLVVVMDCTGSMSAWIDEAKSSILSIIDKIKVDHVNATVRVGFVAYRDFCDGAKRLEVHPLSEEIHSVRTFISTLGAFGGGDGPEDIPGGLEAAMRMDFQAGANRIILVADAPCHGNKYHDSRDDQTYAAEIRASPDICAQMRTLARNCVDLTIVDIIPSSTAKMIAILEAEYNSAKPSDASDSSFVKVTLATSSDVSMFAKAVHSTASSSLAASKAKSLMATAKKVMGVSTFHHYGPTGKRTLGLSTAMARSEKEDSTASSAAPIAPVPVSRTLVWSELDTMPEIAAVRHSYHFRPGERIDWANLELKHTIQQTSIKMLPYSFAKGAMRSAHAMYDTKMGKRFVAKCYYGKLALRTAEQSARDLQTDVEMQMVAKQLATEFSLASTVEDAVDFIFTCWYEIKDTATAKLTGLTESMHTFSAEPYVQGEYKKYNNNNGWINDGNLKLSDTAQAFSHFTWQKSFGQVMVVDLQGVGGIFTDPQIHAMKEDSFGHGNLSKAGMIAFFATHECNEVCAALHLIPCSEGGKTTKPKRSPRGPKGEVRDKSMTCSCPLCGTILTVLHSVFIQAHGKGREVYCSDCMVKVNQREPHSCNICKEEIMFSPYWYDMKGMEHPSTCKKCKAKAAGASG